MRGFRMAAPTPHVEPGSLTLRAAAADAGARAWLPGAGPASRSSACGCSSAACSCCWPLATVAIALSVLQDEKELSHRNYREGFAKTMGQVAAQLRHPAGQLALLNPPAPRLRPTRRRRRVHPLVLPFAALDFDDHNKVEQAVEMAGCTRQYPGDAALCVAVGSNPYAGGFVYVVGHAPSPPPVAHAHRRARPHAVAPAARGRRRCVATTTAGSRRSSPSRPPPSTCCAAASPASPRTPTATCVSAPGARLPRLALARRPVPGWRVPRSSTCARRAFFSVRLPVEVLHDDVVASPHPVWPPADMNRIDVHVQWLAPGDAAPLFDSARAGATRALLARRPGRAAAAGRDAAAAQAGRHRSRAAGHHQGRRAARAAAVQLGCRRPSTTSSATRCAACCAVCRCRARTYPIEATETIRTAAGSYELHGFGDERSANRGLAVVATRVSWFVVAMLVALALAWGAIEWTIIRRITMLTKRSRAVTAAVVDDAAGPPSGRWSTLDIADLRSADELGVLATCLAELLQRVDESMQRERLRAEREKDQWMAVGHEIMSPLQSLIALHGAPDDASRRYILRMQQAIRVLYGSASPSEAFESTTLQLATLELDAFLAEVAANAPHAGIADVRLRRPRRAGGGARRRISAGGRRHARAAERPAPSPRGHARHAAPARGRCARDGGTAQRRRRHPARADRQDLRVRRLGRARGRAARATRRPRSAARACSSPRPTWPRWAAPSPRRTCPAACGSC